MSSTEPPTSPEDPDWVQSILDRALERSSQEAGSGSADLVAGSRSRSGPAPEPMSSPPSPSSDPPVDRAAEELPSGADAAEPAAESPQRRDTVGAGDSTSGSAGPEEGFVGSVQISDPDAAPWEATEPADLDLGSTTFASELEAEDTADEIRFEEALGPLDVEPAEIEGPSRRLRSFLEWGAVIVGALAVALLIKAFLMQAYYIPSGSMEPTLKVDDRVLVNKLSYKLGDVSRGDLVVFNRPDGESDGEEDLIKRVIALPGETIEIHEGRIYILPVGETELRQLVEPYLAEGVVTTGFENTDRCERSTATSCLVPEEHVFVMGDNRGGSKDSRFFGPIREEAIVGRAFIRVWPLGDISLL